MLYTPKMSNIMYGNEENVPVRENPRKHTNEIRNLPPNVSGSSRGHLELSLDKIQWNVTNYPGVTTRISWWGESYDQAACLK